LSVVKVAAVVLTVKLEKRYWCFQRSRISFVIAFTLNLRFIQGYA